MGLFSSDSEQKQVSTVNANLDLHAQDAQSTSFGAIKNYQKLADSQSALNSNSPAEYTKLLQQFMQSGGIPTDSQQKFATQYAQSMFQPQQSQLNNSFLQQLMQNNQQAASLGRSINDPILAAKLGQSQSQQQQVLSGEQTAFGNQMALRMPQQQLDLASALSNQAFQNQTGLFGMGNQFLTNQQQWALATGDRTTTGTGQGNPSLMQIASGFSGISGGGASLANSGAFTGFGGGGAGGGQYVTGSMAGYGSGGSMAGYGGGGAAGVNAGAAPELWGGAGAGTGAAAGAEAGGIAGLGDAGILAAAL